MFAYKVVTNYNNRFFSYSAFTERDEEVRDEIIEYKVGEKTYPKVSGTKLFVVDTLKNAICLLDETKTQDKIFLCEIADEGNIIADSDGCVIDWALVNFRLKKIEKYEIGTLRGTILTDWVKLIREVSLEEIKKVSNLPIKVM